MPMPFGKHKGKKMANIPADYLLHLLDNYMCYGSVKAYIQENEDVLRKETEK
jgi:uncharacterized protein (DUF3820 family)